MKTIIKFFVIISFGIFMTSCVAKKKYISLQNQLQKAQNDYDKCGNEVQDYKDKLARIQQENDIQKNTVKQQNQSLNELKEQIADLRKVRDKQIEQVGNLTVLTKSANDNIDKTLAQLQQKDQYINLLHAAKSKTDSMNLALAVNLTSALRDGIADKDVDIKVDKTVVMINLSDKMLFNTGSYKISARANEVLGKIAQIVQSRPELEVMVEGYTDNVNINTDCITDNWDLSVKRATSVVRTLQSTFKVDPNKLIAAGRGEFNSLSSNDTDEGRAINRRTRIILMPKLNQFYDLLNPNNAQKN